MFISVTLGNKINILYTANINATYKDCNCGKDPLGGLNRIKTYVDEYRKNNDNVLFIDGGNFFNSYKNTELNQSALRALEFLNYDLLAAGIHIFTEDRSFFYEFLRNFSKTTINSNCNLETTKFKEFNINGTRVRFYAFISPNVFKYSKQPDWLTIDDKIVNFKNMPGGINILIYNGFKTDAELFLKNNNNFDILFLSYDQQFGIWKSGNTTIIGGGHDAESIALVEILEVNNIKQIQLNYIKMDSTINSSDEIMQLFQKFDSSGK
jgi:hypothetical protein